MDWDHNRRRGYYINIDYLGHYRGRLFYGELPMNVKLLMSHDDLISAIKNQKVLQTHLGVSRSQAWRLYRGYSRLTMPARELLMIKLGLHDKINPNN